MRQKPEKQEPLRSSRRALVRIIVIVLLMLLLGGARGQCGEREAVSSQGPRVLKTCGQARRAGAPWGPVGRTWAGEAGGVSPRQEPVRAAQPTGFPRARGQSTGFQCPSTAPGGWVETLRSGLVRHFSEGTIVLGGGHGR